MSEYFQTAMFADASIAFDLDGTLVDTAPDLIRALNQVVGPRGLEPVALADVRAMVGRGSRALIERAFAREQRQLDAIQTDDLVAAFIDSYRSGIADHSQLFPDVVATLELMKDAGADLSVCTNKPSELSDLLVETLDLTEYFDRIIGPERTTAKKPAAAHVEVALGNGHSHAAMIGDSAPDVDAARAAGVPSIILSYGYSEKPVSSLGADRVLHAFKDIPKTLAELWRETK
jgi:phosphoglycolate phosphatase